MSDQTRRYLSEDWDEDPEPVEEKPASKPTKKSLAQDRRQKEKQWGKAIDKFHRERSKWSKEHRHH